MQETHFMLAKTEVIYYTKTSVVFYRLEEKKKNTK